MFLPRILLLFSRKLLESPDDAETCVARFDDIVDVAVSCCIVRVAEEIVVLLCVDVLEDCHSRSFDEYQSGSHQPGLSGLQTLAQITIIFMRCDKN